MKKRFYPPIALATIVVFVITSCIHNDSGRKEIAVIPHPVSLLEGSGVFTVKSSTVIAIEAVEPTMSADLEKIAEMLIDRLFQAAGIRLKKTPTSGGAAISAGATSSGSATTSAGATTSGSATSSGSSTSSGSATTSGSASSSRSAAPSCVDNVIRFREVEGLGTEAYRLRVSPSEVVIESSAPNGAFYALQTLLQLLPPEIYAQKRSGTKRWTIPAVVIEDEPRFSYRGMHLDVCLHFFPVEFIKRYLDMMAIHKMNVFHWHLTEDQGWRIEIKRYPELTQKGAIRKETVIGTLKSKFYDGTPHGGYYTQDEIREVVQYAADRYITIIPEIEMPGHALAAITCFPELSCGLEEQYELATRWGVFRQVFCPKEGTFTFLENVLEEVMELFPSKYIHIGGDECPKTSWKQCSHCQKLIATLKLKDEFELQSYFIQRIEKFINSRGRMIIGWDEILQGGLAPNATVMSWLGEEGGIKAAQQRHDVVMCPHTSYYLDYYQADPRSEKLAMGHLVTLRKMYDYNPVPQILTPEEQKHIIGVQGCVWTEYMPTPERVEYMAWPRAAAIAEAGWSKAEHKEWKHFTQRLEHHFQRFDHLNLHACRAFFDVRIAIHEDGTWSKVVTMEADAPDAEIRYTTDGSEPTAQSTPYNLPFVINKSQIVKAAAFRNGARLGKVTQRGFD